MANITKYTSQSVTITASNIKNTAHFKGIIVNSSDSNLVPFTGYYLGASSKTVTIKSSISDSSTSSKIVTLDLGGYFYGASNSYTVGEYANQTIEVRQHNTISNVTARSIWVGDSNTITWSDTQNAYQKTAEITLSNGSLISAAGSLSSVTSGAGRVTATTEGLSASTSSVTTIVTVKSKDPIHKSATATWTIKNPVNTITPSKTSIQVNAGTNTNTSAKTEGTHGHVSLSAKASNTNGFDVFSDNIKFAAGSHLQVNNTTSATVASGTNVTITPDGVITSGTSGTVTLTAVDGANKVSAKTVNVLITVPTFASKSLNVGEKWTADVSSKASGTSVTKIELFSTSTGTSSTSVATVSSNKIVTAVSQGTVYPRFTLSDGAVFRGGTISIAAALTVQILKRDKSSVAADANFGDTLFVKVTGGKSGETFNLSTSGGTLNKTTKVTTSDYVVLTLPKSGSGTETVTVTASPASGGSNKTTSVSVQNITFALS